MMMNHIYSMIAWSLPEMFQSSAQKLPCGEHIQMPHHSMPALSWNWNQYPYTCYNYHNIFIRAHVTEHKMIEAKLSGGKIWDGHTVVVIIHTEQLHMLIGSNKSFRYGVHHNYQ